jgi:hypothetical protein
LDTGTPTGPEVGVELAGVATGSLVGVEAVAVFSTAVGDGFAAVAAGAGDDPAEAGGEIVQ